jgi:hypothetical protein
VRTALLALTVWRDVCTLLDHPERLAEAYRRRLQPETRTKRTPLTTVEGQISQRRQGVARLIDRSAEGLIDKGECEPRVPRLRQRLARLEEQRQALADEAAVHGELPLILGRLEDVATKLHDGLEAADWASKRDLIRALLKRVEVARDAVNIVLRIDPYPGDADPEKKVGNFVGGVVSPLMANIYLHELDMYMESKYRNLSHYERQRRRKKGQGNDLYVRYADDFVVLCNGTKAEAHATKEERRGILTNMGLTLSEEKTKITHMTEGFKFLGYWIERSVGTTGKMVPKVYIPKDAMTAFRHKIRRMTAPNTEGESVNAQFTA